MLIPLLIILLGLKFTWDLKHPAGTDPEETHRQAFNAVYRHDEEDYKFDDNDDLPTYEILLDDECESD